MTERSLDSLGPIDLVVVAFPPGQANFSGEVVGEIAKLVEAGTIRVLDLLLLAKDAGGAVQVGELAKVEGLDTIEAVEFELAALLAAADVIALAEALPPDSLAGVLVYESLWAAPFAAAARRAGGQLIANQRIPIQGLIAAAEADGE